MLGLVFSFPEDSLTDNVFIAIQEAVDGMNAETGNTDLVGVGVDEGDGESAPPVFDNGALLPGKSPSGFPDRVPTHKALTSSSP
jgi:hypothetical protein